VDAAVIVLIPLVLAVLVLVVVLIRRLGQSSSAPTTEAPAPVIDHTALVTAVREAVDAQVRKTTSETLADTSQRAGEMLEQRGQLIAEQTKGLLDPFAAQLTQLKDAVGQMTTTFEGDKATVREMAEQLTGRINTLNATATQLAGALKSPAARGAWGENQLRNIIELSGMAPYCDFAEQTVAGGDSGRQRPDLTVNLPNGAFIVVDSKVPLSAYLEMQDAADEAERQRFLVEHGKAMRAHVKALAEKRYWEQFPESPDFVVMFVPGESFLADALRVDASLAEDAMRSRVVVTSPMSLMALLLTVARGWQTRQIAENATKVQHEAAELYRRIDTVLESMAKTGRGLTSATDAYNKMVGSVEARLLPSMRRFRDYGVPGDDLTDVPQLEHTVREIGAEEMRSAEIESGSAGELEA